MKVRATTVNRFYNPIRKAWCMSGRIEIRGTSDCQWVNLGIQTYAEYDWLLIVALMIAGARVTGIDMEHTVING